MQSSKLFWDRVAPKYAEKPISNPDAYQETLARTRSYLGRDDSVLELGCGTGSTALTLSDAVAEILGTDISSGMIDIAREKTRTQGIENARFMVATADDLTAAGERRFDVVMAFNLMHLVPDAEATLDDVATLLKPGGLFISKTPCLGRKLYFWPLIKAMQLVGKAPFVRFLKVETYDLMIEAAGFEIIETGLYPPSAPNRFVVARKT